MTSKTASVAELRSLMADVVETTIDAQEFNDWVTLGVERGWISEPVCSTHDRVPTTANENEAWEQGLDPCIPVIRVWGHGKK